MLSVRPIWQLLTVSSTNQLAKYVDDTCLIIPASNVKTRATELDNLRFIFVDSRRRCAVELPSPLTGVNCVTSMKMLGVTVKNTLSVAEHVRGIIRGCAPSIYALCVLRSHGLNDAELQSLSSCYRHQMIDIRHQRLVGLHFTTSDDRQRIEGLLKCGIRADYYRPDCPTVENLVEDADDVLIRRVLNN